MKRALGFVIGALALASGCELLAVSGEISGKALGDGGASTGSALTGGTSSTGATGSTSISTTAAAPTCADLVSWVRVIEVNKVADLRLAFDADVGHVVAAFSATGTVTADGQSYPPAAGETGRDVFVARYDSAGFPRLARRLGDAGDQQLGGIAASLGSTYVGLHYTGSLGLGTSCDVPHAQDGDPTAVLARIDASGLCQEAQDAMGGYSGRVLGLAADEDALYVAATIQSGGQVNYARMLRTAGWPNSYYSALVGDIRGPLIAGAAGNTFIAGTFAGNLSYGGENLASAQGGTKDGFLMRGSANYPTPPDVRKLGESSADPVLLGLAADASSPYVTGALASQVTLGGTALGSHGLRDVFVARAGANAFGAGDWLVSFGAAGDEWGTAVAVSGTRVAVAGVHTGGLTIAGEPGGLLPAHGGHDVFVTGLAAGDGTPLWACSFGGSEDDDALAAVIGNDGAVYVAGSFRGVADFGKSADGKNGAIFLMRITPP